MELQVPHHPSSWPTAPDNASFSNAAGERDSRRNFGAVWSKETTAASEEMKRRSRATTSLESNNQQSQDGVANGEEKGEGCPEHPRPLDGTKYHPGLHVTPITVLRRVLHSAGGDPPRWFRAELTSTTQPIRADVPGSGVHRTSWRKTDPGHHPVLVAGERGGFSRRTGWASPVPVPRNMGLGIFTDTVWAYIYIHGRLEKTHPIR